MSTQMEQAKNGVITTEMRTVADKEGLSAEGIRLRMAAGSIVIPANHNHTSLSPEGVGHGLKTKINVNLGISPECANLESELAKVRMALDMKAEAIMDLSNYGKTIEFRHRLIEMSSAMIGSVPMYDALGYLDKKLEDITPQEFLAVVEQHAQDGVDFVTIHAGINKETAQHFRQTSRVTNIVSRGGSLLYAWMELTGQENPFMSTLMIFWISVQNMMSQ